MKTMMKRIYIKPEIELLDSNLQVILCVSTGSTMNGEDIDDKTNPNPNGARSFDDDFGFDE